MKPGTDAVYAVSDHVDAIHARAGAAGANVTVTLRDTEGNAWTIGTYRGEP